jgi:asparagine synthase (glutamine-hydrolysing)
MFRYVALVWNGANGEQHSTAKLLAERVVRQSQEWQTVLATEHCLVLCAGARRRENETYAIANDQGVVLGKLFSRDAIGCAAAPDVLAGDDGVRVVHSGGRQLVDRYWGRYVAFWRDTRGAVCALRDPTGTLPCYETTFRGVRIYFSWLDDCLKTGLLHFTIDWDFIAALVPLAIISCRATGLNEVRQVLQGECVRWHAGEMARELLWDPCRFAAMDAITDAAVAESALRDTVRQCVHAWASCYASILHRMSGGIDSTIVLSCLRDAPTRPKVTGLIHYSSSPRSDERPFARLAARSANCTLVECERNPAARLEPLLHMHPLPEPHSCLPYTQNDGLERRVAADCDASAVFSGGGGDQLFFQGRTTLAASDYLRQRGPRPALLFPALNGARLERISVWRVLRSAISDAIGPRPLDPLADVGKHWQLLRPGLVDDVRRDRRFLHPWVDQAADLPIGKQHQVYSLRAPHTYYDSRGQANDPEYVHPLASQPLVETVLRIPTWILTTGGWDRALARRAFSSDMPTEIVTRRTKGAADVQLESLLIQNIDWVRDQLLSGFLVQNRLVDGIKLEAVLSGRTTCPDSPTVEIYHYVSVESWLRGWAAAPTSAAA